MTFMMKKIAILLLLLLSFGCKNDQPKQDIAENKAPEKPFVWENANIYFLLTDRFNNADTSNDINFDRTDETGVLRGFEGGDIKGVTQKIKEGYFTDLGINAIWMTPIVEQIHGSTDEGTGVSYGYHGYWAKDWTKIDPNFGTTDDLKELVEIAHQNGIRILLDAVINHTGPATDQDPAWPDEWVRTSPQCTYDNYENTIMCTLVENLPDIRTDSNEEVGLPPQLKEKWKAEGRYEQEMAELDAFFERTGHPRAPRFYIMKWLTDYITDFGIDGYRVDTVKHTEEFVWQEFKVECDNAFKAFKKDNPDKVLDDNDFYLVGEVYNYVISGGQYFDYGDKKVNYFDPPSFHSLINFEFKWNIKQMAKQQVFHKYDSILQNQLKDYGTLNYITSHDDGQPFDKPRAKSLEGGTMLLLSPGASQVYYGDETDRSLTIDGTVGDATLRSFMNWEQITAVDSVKNTLSHYQKLGQFRNNHPAVGAGKHQLISKEPLVFSRRYTKGDYKDEVVIALDLKDPVVELNVSSVFEDNQEVVDAYSGKSYTVEDGKVSVNPENGLVLLEAK
jgi:alpha-amylase